MSLQKNAKLICERTNLYPNARPTRIAKQEADNLLETLACRLTNVPYMVSADIDRLKHNIPDPAYNIISVKVRIKKYNPKGIDVPYIEVEYVRND